MAEGVHRCVHPENSVRSNRSHLNNRLYERAGLINLALPPMIFRSLITLSVSLCLEVWLSILLYRRRVSKLAPAFATYIAAAVLVSLVRFLTLSQRQRPYIPELGSV